MKLQKIIKQLESEIFSLNEQEENKVKEQCLINCNIMIEILKEEKPLLYYNILKAMEEYAQSHQVEMPGDEEVGEPIQNALYATNNFTTDQCNTLTDGILEYLKDAGFRIIKSKIK